MLNAQQLVRTTIEPHTLCRAGDASHEARKQAQPRQLAPILAEEVQDLADVFGSMRIVFEVGMIAHAKPSTVAITLCAVRRPQFLDRRSVARAR